MTLQEWARRWNLPQEALDEMRSSMMLELPVHQERPSNSEAATQQRVRLDAAQRGEILWRNNVGAMQDDTGRVVRYGLANESKAMNQSIKSSDLIGIRPLTVTPDHVGFKLGIFVAREVKAPGWRFSGTQRELAQQKFLDLVRLHGGDAAFVC